MMKKKRILFVEQNIDGTIGGSHYCLLYLIQHLNRRLFDPVVMFYKANQLLKIFDREAEVTVFRIQNFVHIKPAFVRKFTNLLINLFVILKCYLFLIKHRIDIIHLNNSVSGGYVTWLVAGLMANVPCVTHERNFTIYPKTRLFKVLSKKYKRILPVSHVIGEHIIKQGFDPDMVETIHDGIEPDRIRNKVKRSRVSIMDEFCIKQNNFIIGLIGNIRRWKGQELLIDALHIVNKTIPNFVCLLVGDVGKNSKADSDYKKLLEKKIIQYGLENKIVFTGYRNDVPDIIRVLDLQINSSIEPDPFPHVILEGMSLEKVVIATNLGGAIESIDDGISGFLVPPDSHKLAKKIVFVLSDPDLRDKMSANAIERIKLFSMANTMSKLEKIYGEI